METKHKFVRVSEQCPGEFPNLPQRIKGLGNEKFDGNRDQADAAKLYRILEEEIIPLYYRVSDEGIPQQWVRVMKEAIKSTAAQFSARRMVKEYTAKFYSAALKNV